MYFKKENGVIKGDFKSLPDGQYICKEVKETRSLKINNYYWLLLGIISDEFKNYGYINPVNYLHELFKKCFLPRKRVKSDFSKNYVYVFGSTATLHNKEFVEYLNNIKLICEFGEFDKLGLEKIGGFVLPQPNDSELLTYIDKIIKYDTTGSI